MKPAALVGDSIFCPNTPQCQYPPKGPYCPVGVITYVTPKKTFISGRNPAAVGDKGTCCSITVLTTGSTKVFVEGKPVHRVTDKNSCGGYTTGPGDPRCFIG